MFIHPGDEDPEQVIGFRDHRPYPRKNNSRGRHTIQELGLLRQELMTVRADYLKKIQLLRDAAKKLPPGSNTRDEIEKHLQDATKDSAPFASMVRSLPP